MLDSLLKSKYDCLGEIEARYRDLLTSKDERLLEKYKRIRETEVYYETLLKFKDELIIEKDKRLEGKDELLSVYMSSLLLAQEIPHTQELMQHYLWKCFDELQLLEEINNDETFEVNAFISKLKDPSFVIPENAYHTHELLGKLHRCGHSDLKQLYSELCKYEAYLKSTQQV